MQPNPIDIFKTQFIEAANFLCRFLPTVIEADELKRQMSDRSARRGEDPEDIDSVLHTAFGNVVNDCNTLVERLKENLSGDRTSVPLNEAHTSVVQELDGIIARLHTTSAGAERSQPDRVIVTIKNRAIRQDWVPGDRFFFESVSKIGINSIDWKVPKDASTYQRHMLTRFHDIDTLTSIKSEFAKYTYRYTNYRLAAISYFEAMIEIFAQNCDRLNDQRIKDLAVHTGYERLRPLPRLGR